MTTPIGHPRRSASARAAVALAILLTAACSGGDDDVSSPDATADATASAESTATAEPTASDESTGETNASSGEDATGSVEETEPSGDDTGSANDSGSGVDLSSGDAAERCAAIFDEAEVTDLFEEPVTLDASVNDSLGQTVCTWSTIDEDADDLSGGVLTVQVFSGDPIPATSFVDPDIFDEVTPIEGVGDQAFSTEDLGTSFYFLDEPVAGALTYGEFDFGDPDAPKRRTYDDIEALFRTFHDRVT